MINRVFDNFGYFCIKCIIILTMLMILSISFSSVISLCNLISVMIWFYSLFKIGNTNKYFCLLMLPLIWLYTFAILSELYFEQFSSFTPELVQMTFATGGLIKLVFYNIILFWGAHISFHDVKVQVRPATKFNKYLIYIMYVSIVIMLLASLLIYGIPLFEGMNRFVFWNREVENPMMAAARVNAPLLVLLLMLLYNEKKRLIILLLLLLVILTVLGGDKFSAFINFLLYMCIVFFSRKELNTSWQYIVKMLLILSLVFVGLFSLVYYHYTEISNVINVADMFESRLVEQGQVWWITDQLMLKNENWFLEGVDGFFYEIIAGFSSNVDPFYHGMYTIMKLITSQDMVVQYYTMGVEFTEGYPAIGLIYFGYFGLIPFQLLMGMFYGRCAFILYKSICIADAPACFLMGKINFLFVIGLVGGNLWKLLSYKTLICLLLYFIWVKYKYRRFDNV